jgi:aminoglycoside phosphotransferase (APT) family kinase protein/broad specificity phosphatase PhoE
LMRHGNVAYFDATGQPVLPETVPLDAQGCAEADAAGHWFKDAKVTFDRIIVSGLPRTVETAQRVLAAMGLVQAIEHLPALREIEGGKLTSIPKAELASAFTGAFTGVVAGKTRFLGGESVDEMFARVVPAIDALRADPHWHTVLLVLHGGVNRALLSYLLTGEQRLLGGLHQETGCINAIDVGDARDDVNLRFCGLAPMAPLQTKTRQTTMEVLLQTYLSTRTPMFDHFIGVKPVSEKHKVDEAALAHWLGSNMDGFAGPLSIEQFKGGQSNPTFRLTTPTMRYVMRTKPGPAARLLPSAHQIEREYAVMHALRDSEVPVPRMVALCEDENIIGRAFYVMEHIDGRVLWDPTLPGMTSAERAAIFDEMNRVISALHRVNVEAVGLADYGKPGNFFERQIARWSKQYRASETERIDAMDALIDWLPAHIPPGEETRIVHGDFRLDNIVFHATEPRALAVLDWELSTLGHPLADFAYHAMAWHVPTGAFRGLLGTDLASLGIPDAQTYVKRYCERTGRTDIPHYEFYLAYNMFRMAGILQGVMKRHLDGTASSAQAESMGKAARPLAEMGLTMAQRVR